ncbi:MAG: hypothetical protein JSW46_10970 [Gemmatimonadota bacterium]|nr:MAG: hypothetical protein JSW46_10970 [Gemmatimonadota bacterium]
MKLVYLMYLADDERCVNRLLGEQEITAFSRLPVEGHGPGSAVGWTGEIQPFRSQVVMAILPDEKATALMEAVASCTAVEDPRHPIRAVQLSVEHYSCCQLENQP